VRTSLTMTSLVLAAMAVAGSAGGADEPPASKPVGSRRIESIADGRLCIGNGYWLACFVGPLEEPEKPVYQVHDKISRLWLGYSSPQLQNVGMAPRIKNLSSGQEWVIGPCSGYRFEDGVLVMETRIGPGTVRTETFGLWDRPVLVRRISFTPEAGIAGNFQISTEASLYRGSLGTAADQAKAGRDPYSQDERERPPVVAFPLRETLRVSKADSSATWVYDNPLYRKAVIAAAEPQTEVEILGRPAAEQTVFEGQDAGALRFARNCGAKEGSLTLVMAFDRDLDQAERLLAASRTAGHLADVQQRWRQWFEVGAVVRTGNKKLDQAYRVQMMYLKIAQDAELGGIIVGARYQITTVWTRDSGVAISALLDAGHYEEARKALRFFSRHAYWNPRNNCLHANMHASGRVMKFICGPDQPPLEDILQPREWTIQMLGPQLDGMGYYLYNIGKYYRCTGDREFIRQEWPFISKVAGALAADDYCTSEAGKQGEYTAQDLRFKKYNPQTGLIVDNCYEDGVLRETILTNALAASGFRQAYALSQVMGEAVPLWKQRADDLDAAIREHCAGKDGKGRYLIEWFPRPWILKGQEVPVASSGYVWSIAATVPYYNYTDQVFKDTFRRFVDPKGRVGGWGMWFASLAHAAFAADQADVGWNYLGQVLDQLPESLQLYEHNQDVTGEDGVTRHVTLNLFGFSYLPHAVIRGLAGLGYDERTRHHFLRPQVPDGFGPIQSHIRIGGTSFDLASTGNGEDVAEFRIDGVGQPRDGILDGKYLDGRAHAVEIRMTKRPAAQDASTTTRP
jgi:hypothetical protein